MKKTKTYNRISDVLKTNRQWCKGNYHNDHGRYCLMGAISKVYPWSNDKRFNIDRKVNKYVRSLGYECPINFNDAKSTTFKDIQKLMKKLGI
jgi:hypothetical protein